MEKPEFKVGDREWGIAVTAVVPIMTLFILITHGVLVMLWLGGVMIGFSGRGLLTKAKMIAWWDGEIDA